MKPLQSDKEATETRKDYRYFLKIPTRWMDIDANGHLNQAEYHSFFDTALLTHLIQECGFDPYKGDTMMFCVENQCRYRRELKFPQTVEVGMRVAHLGNSSVRYEFAIFTSNEEHPAATGYFTDVFIDRKTRRSKPIPAVIRPLLENVLYVEKVRSGENSN